MLETKYRLLILLSIVGVIASTLPIPLMPVNQIAILLNINPQDPRFVDTENMAIFQYHNGTTEKTMTVNVTEVQLESNLAKIKITTDSIYWIQTTLDGLIINTNRYTIFWLHLADLSVGGVFAGIDPGTVFNVTDPIGLIGAKDANYTAIVDRRIVYWSLDAGLHGAQFSFQVTFYNESNNAVMGQALYDSTCGMLFTLEGGAPYTQIKLLETTFEISRNRLTVLPWAIGLFAGVTVVAYILMKKRWKLEGEKVREVTLLLAAGGAVWTVDLFVAVWFYAIIGYLGNILLYVGVFLGLLVICIYQKYKLSCITPALLELGFVLTMVRFVGENYVPHLTAFWGLILSWLIMLHVSRYSPQPAPTKKWERIASEFV